MLSKRSLIIEILVKDFVLTYFALIGKDLQGNPLHPKVSDASMQRQEIFVSWLRWKRAPFLFKREEYVIIKTETIRTILRPFTNLDLNIVCYDEPQKEKDNGPRGGSWITGKVVFASVAER